MIYPRFSALHLSLTLLVGVASSTSWGQWSLGGNTNATNNGLPAQLSDDCIQLTTTQGNVIGTAWHDCTMNLNLPFDLNFEVNLGNNNGGADGMCFVLPQSGTGNNLFGASGGGLGYEGSPLNPSLCVEIDTYQNGDLGDPSEDHIAIQSNTQNTHNTHKSKK